MLPVRVVEQHPEADLAGFRRVIADGWRGEARARPRDCTGRRFLVREAARERFEALAARHQLTLEEDTREAFG